MIIRLLDGARDRWIGPAEVKSKFGVEPDKVVEVMGLMGDPVDNIPGVKGIGEKSAIALIERFGTLEELYRQLDEIEKMPVRGAARLRELLDNGIGAAFLSRALATVNRHVPLAICLEELRVIGFDQKEIRALFTELEFTNLIKLFEYGRL